MPGVCVARSRDIRVGGARMCWITYDGTILNIEEAFGPRTLITPLAPLGRLDFHRGVDILLANGAPIYSPISGVCSRSVETHFGFDTETQLAQFELVDPFGALSVAHGTSCVELTAARVGAASFPDDIARYQPIRQRVSPKNGEDWVAEINIATMPTTGSIGVGLFSPSLSEYVALECNTTSFTLRCVGTTTFTIEGDTFAFVSGTEWLRISYTADTDTFAWQRSSDGETFVDIATETGRSFASALTTHVPTIYWRSSDTDATPYDLQVDAFNWYDADRQTPRFGNYGFYTNGVVTVVIQHMRELVVRQGERISVGQLLGYAGNEGFDAYSGDVVHDHAHVEVFWGNSALYDVDLTQNPLGAGFFPHLNAPSVVVVRTSENDPDGVASWRLAITIQRVGLDYQGLTVNEISCTGNLGTRTINMNERVGFDPANHDATPYSGVFTVGGSMSDVSTETTWNYYFHKSVVGSTFASLAVADTEGVVLDSE